MTATPHVSSPRLAPPGAGLPLVELLIARWLFQFRRLTVSRARAEAQIVAERDAVLALVRGITPEQGSRRVLIPRPRGLEDSSRHWSVFMTLQHVEIVNRQTARTIARLLAGETPSGQASTAAVKPSPTADATSIEAFAKSCDLLRDAGAGASTLRTTSRFAHPWFGPLDAAGWKVMGAMHLGLHRAQLVTIAGELARVQ